LGWTVPYPRPAPGSGPWTLGGPSWPLRVRPVGALVRSDRESDRREPGVVLRSLMQPDQSGAPSNRHRRRRARRLRRRHRHGDGQPRRDGL